MPFSSSLLTAVAIQLLCQLFKVVFYSIKEHRPRLKYFVSAGGMPSAHTAFVSALAVSVGLNRGFSSEFFSIAFVFSSIIVYDIVRVRGAVQTHSRILAVLLEKLPLEDRLPLPQLVGHTIGEILIGLGVGAGFAAAVHFVL
jgi:acid phosphatase family membrane protein YuiD